jgi:hypothetical protein
MIREWRHLKMLKRSGYGHLEDEVEKQSHSCALLCPACPQPGINLPPDWENAPKEKRFWFKSDRHFYRTLTFIQLYYFSWLYALFLALDGNFRMSRRGASSDQRDPSLTQNRGYFVDRAELAAHLEAHKGQPQEASKDYLFPIYP